MSITHSPAGPGGDSLRLNAGARSALLQNGLPLFRTLKDLSTCGAFKGPPPRAEHDVDRSIPIYESINDRETQCATMPLVLSCISFEIIGYYSTKNDIVLLNIFLHLVSHLCVPKLYLHS